MSQRFSTCRTCGAQILWVHMRGSGKRMPIDADSLQSRVVLNKDQTLGAVRQTGVSHFATCPQADEHRRGAE